MTRASEGRHECLFIIADQQFEPCWPAVRLNLLRRRPDQCPDRQFNDPAGITQETPMFRKSILLAFAASAALGLAMLSPTIASAKGGHGGGGHGMHGGGHHGHGHHGHHGRGHRHGHRHRPHWHRHYVRWHRPVVYSSYSAPVAGPCTCLSKEYTQEGAVLFKDRCTNEMAMNPPAQAPQQTGQLETQQPQTAQYQAQYVQPQPSYPPQAK
jgi:hypothetical protein